ncbi:MAG: hypothetical protein WDA68_07820 [Phycisphaerae bacterium]
MADNLLSGTMVSGHLFHSKSSRFPPKSCRKIPEKIMNAKKIFYGFKVF